MEQRDYSFTKESFVEMLHSIRERSGDTKVIYLFVDNAGYHSNKENKDNEKNIVREAYQELNIVPVFNVGYKYVYNPVERYWSLVKQYYRKVLLEKMLKCPTAKEFPMRDAMFEVFTKIDVTKSIPKYIKKA